MAPRLGSMSSNLWEPAVACNGNLWFPGWEPWVPTSRNRQFLAMVTCGSHVGNREWVPTFGNRQFLAMNQSQTFRYRSIKQNKAFFTGPLSLKQNHKILKKLFSYHFDMHLFRAKTFLCRPNSQTQPFRYRSIKQNKRFCYRLSKQNKTILRTMRSLSFWNQQILPLVTFTFSGLEPWVSNFGNPQFLTMIVA